MKNRVLAALIGVIVLQPQPIIASGCLREIIRKIDIDPVTMCWRHKGTGTHFRGSFRKGDVVTAKGRGKNPWDLSVNGPRDFGVSQDSEKPLVFTAPQDGTYDISIGPCSEWGDTGKVSVCLRRSDATSETQGNGGGLTDSMIRGRWGHVSLSCSDSMEIEAASFFYDGRRYVNEGHDCKVLDSKIDGTAIKLTMQCDLGNGTKYNERKTFVADQKGRIRKDGSMYKKCGSVL